MKQDELMSQIEKLEREIGMLPQGSITKKRIKDKEYYYLRITKDGKRSEKYLSFEEIPKISSQIEKRKLLEKELKKYRTLLPPIKNHQKDSEEKLGFKTKVITGKQLENQISLIRNFKKRECIKKLREYIFGPYQDRVFILYGLRRTGKTTMIRQIIAELSEQEFKKAAFIQIRTKDTLADVDTDLHTLQEHGYRYVFLYEVTLLEDFIEGAALFSDIYASSGMKLVMSGTDSLGFVFSKEEQLYDRCILLHTTFIPYREFEEVLGISGIDEYIRYGGTMSLGGVRYNSDLPFANSKNAGEYVDTAIAKNIQHSLSLYQYGGHFRQLQDLYECDELTNVINRVVENINHSFTKNVVEKTFSSHDISVTALNLLKDRNHPINIKEHMDIDTITLGIMQILDILNKEEQSIDINDAHMSQIKEYLTLLDMVADIDLEYLPDVEQSGKITVITQPGLRYAQAEAIVENILLDVKFNVLSIVERQRILERLLSEIRGRMMEEIILLETKIAKLDKKVFKLQFAIGEFDMVICDPKTLTCEIYEVKYSREKVPDQCRHIQNKEKCAMTEHRYGKITGRYVIYRGESGLFEDVKYLNIEEYLKGLKRPSNYWR